MRQLTALDAQFLALETPRQAGHVGGLTVLDPSTAPGGGRAISRRWKSRSKSGSSTQ